MPTISCPLRDARLKKKPWPHPTSRIFAGRPFRCSAIAARSLALFRSRTVERPASRFVSMMEAPPTACSPIGGCARRRPQDAHLESQSRRYLTSTPSQMGQALRSAGTGVIVWARFASDHVDQKATRKVNRDPSPTLVDTQAARSGGPHRPRSSDSSATGARFMKAAEELIITSAAKNSSPRRADYGCARIRRGFALGKYSCLRRGKQSPPNRAFFRAHSMGLIMTPIVSISRRSAEQRKHAGLPFKTFRRLIGD